MGRNVELWRSEEDPPAGRSNPPLRPFNLVRARGAGYADAAGTPSAELQKSFEFVDASLGKMLDALDDAHLTRKTLFIVGAKHGQSPIDVATLHMQVGSANPK